MLLPIRTKFSFLGLYTTELLPLANVDQSVSETALVHQNRTFVKTMIPCQSQAYSYVSTKKNTYPLEVITHASEIIYVSVH